MSDSDFSHRFLPFQLARMWQIANHLTLEAFAIVLPLNLAKYFKSFRPLTHLKGHPYLYFANFAMLLIV